MAKLGNGLNFLLYAFYGWTVYTLRQFISLIKDLRRATEIFLPPLESGPQDIKII